MLLDEYQKEGFLKNIRVFLDEPDPVSDFFHFDKYSNQLSTFILNLKQEETPFSIAINGEWGSGKTSLMRKVHNLIDEPKYSTQGYKLVWFNAWEYELLDPILSLFYKISSKYPKAKTKKFKEIMRKIGPVLLHNVPPAVGLLGTSFGIPLPLGNFKFDKLVENFDSPSNVFVPTIATEIGNMIQDGKLVVFIDDLDRCKIENILGILEAVKIFLQSKGVVIVMGVDISMLERAWNLRYGANYIGDPKALDFLDKIFQLRLSLPEKDPYVMKKYLESIATFLQPEEFDLLYSGFPHNPRKIKKLLNLIYFLATNISQEDFNYKLSLVIIWSICTLEYPTLAEITKMSINAFVYLAFVAVFLRTHTNLSDRIHLINQLNVILKYILMRIIMFPPMYFGISRAGISS